MEEIKTEYENLLDETVMFLIKANQDLVEAEHLELYEQAEFIQTAIDIYLTSHCQALHQMNKSLPASEIHKALKEQGELILKMMRDNEELR